MAPGLQELRGGELEFLGGTQQLTRFHASAAMFKKELDKGDKVEMFIQKEAVSGGEISRRTKDGWLSAQFADHGLGWEGEQVTISGIGQGPGPWQPMWEESLQQRDCRSILGDLRPKTLSLPSALVRGD